MFKFYDVYCREKHTNFSLNLFFIKTVKLRPFDPSKSVYTKFVEY